MKTLDKYSSTKLIKHAPPLTKIMLRLKKDFEFKEIFYFICICFKLLNLSLLVNEYTLILNKSKFTIDDGIISFISLFEFFGVFSITKISDNIYIILSSFFFVFLILGISVFLFLYNIAKKYFHKLFDKKLNLNFILIKTLIIFLFVIIFFSHNLIQFLSRHIVDFFDFFYRNNTNLTSISYPILIMNFISIIFVNLILYNSYFFLNEPFFQSNFAIQMKHSKFTIFNFILMLNFISLNHFYN